MDSPVPKIVSGGQTGADRTALDWALSHDIECGGRPRKGGKPRTVGLPKGIHLLRPRQRATFSGPNGMSGTPGDSDFRNWAGLNRRNVRNGEVLRKGKRCCANSCLIMRSRRSTLPDRDLQPVDRLPVHELSAVNGNSLRFKYSATRSTNHAESRSGRSSESPGWGLP
jgi:hypothetical protein